MKIKAKMTRVPYTKEEKRRFFEEGMIRVPSKEVNKKKYNRKKMKKVNISEC